jgi:hypothetical protein
MKAYALWLVMTLALGATALADGIAVTLNPLSSPMGLGADVSLRLSDRWNVRAGGGLLREPTAEDVRFGDVRYDWTLKLGGANAFVDWYPFAGRFHLSGGVSSIRSPWALRATNVSSYTINGVSYPAPEVGTLSGELDFHNTVAPAVLIGWGNPVRRGKHLGFVFDVGLAYTGREDFVLRAKGPLADDPGFRKGLAAEQERHSTDAGLFPVLKLGVSYQF